MKSAKNFILLALLALPALALLGACNEEQPVQPINNVTEYAWADSIVFWPPTLHYARPNDSLSFRIVGLTRGYECSDKLLDGGWNVKDTADYFAYRLRTTLYQHSDPPLCNRLPGIDSLNKRVFFPRPDIQPTSGKPIYLQAPGRPDSLVSDTLIFVSGTASIYAFSHPVSTGDAVAYGPFTFRDSTAGHPRRTVRAESLATCEILQTAVFKRSGDTLLVRVRRIQANPLPESVLPACAGPHADSVEVVPDLYRFP